MELTRSDIKKIAQLARLELTDSEEEQYARELSGVLDYITILNEVNTDDVPETCQVTGLVDVTRADSPIIPDEALTHTLIAQFPESTARLLKVKAVFEN